MAYTLKPVNKPAAGAGAPGAKPRYAYIALVDDILSFPTLDETGVELDGDITMKTGKNMVPIYITPKSQEYSYETTGDQDARSHKLKFQGTHPGSEKEALEFATNQLDQDFIVIIPACEGDTTKVLGRPCNPLVFRSSHKSDSDNTKFEFIFEQEVGSKYTYFIYTGALALPTTP